MKTHFKVTHDCLFKYIFGNPQNTNTLISLINSVLNDSGFPLIRQADIKKPFSIKEFKSDRESVIDIRAEDENGKNFNIEVQAQVETYFTYRSLYYWARLYSRQMKESEKYSQLSPVVCINILDFKLFKNTDKAHLCFIIKEKDSNW